MFFTFIFIFVAVVATAAVTSYHRYSCVSFCVVIFFFTLFLLASAFLHYLVKFFALFCQYSYAKIYTLWVYVWVLPPAITEFISSNLLHFFFIHPPPSKFSILSRLNTPKKYPFLFSLFRDFLFSFQLFVLLLLLCVFCFLFSVFSFSDNAHTFYLLQPRWIYVYILYMPTYLLAVQSVSVCIQLHACISRVCISSEYYERKGEKISTPPTK